MAAYGFIFNEEAHAISDMWNGFNFGLKAAGVITVYAVEKIGWDAATSIFTAYLPFPQPASGFVASHQVTFLEQAFSTYQNDAEGISSSIQRLANQIPYQRPDSYIRAPDPVYIRAAGPGE